MTGTASSCSPARRSRQRLPGAFLAATIVSALGVVGSLARVVPLRAGAPDRHVTISVVGTNDLHGYVFPFNGRGGLALLGGYLQHLRAARAADAGAVVLLDAGDTFQGGIESNLSEGAMVVDAYNTLGYTAAAIGNHEFDFGPVDGLDPARWPDPRGALKAAAARARYPLLAANLIDEGTGQPVAWSNVAPSVVVSVAGLRIGIVGAMTVDALRSTLGVNVHGLRMAPLAPAVDAEAARLRADGADLVLLTIHAGGRCARFDDAADLSSCDDASEIFRLVRALPRGTLDGIVAGHTHAGLAHLVNGVPIIEALWGGRAFGRMDLTIDRETRRVAGVRLFPPQDLCEAIGAESAACVSPGADGARRAEYEGRAVEPDPRVVRAMAPELARVRAIQAQPLHVQIDTPVRRNPDVGAPLGNLFADAMRDAAGVDAAVNNNSTGGLRADLPAGPLTFGRLYDVFPFDNRLVQLRVTGADLQRVFTDEVRRARPGALAVSGVRVSAGCDAGTVRVRVTRAGGEPIGEDEVLTLVTTDMLAGGAVFAPVAPASGFAVPVTAPVALDVVGRWLRSRGGHLAEAQFLDPERRRWDVAPSLADGCAVH